MLGPGCAEQIWQVSVCGGQRRQRSMHAEKVFYGNFPPIFQVNTLFVFFVLFSPGRFPFCSVSGGLTVDTVRSGRYAL